ncbi:MAG: elongation factor P maturation arginine rhamnosyltransferase EarP [Pseudomonadota bacterium]
MKLAWDIFCTVVDNFGDIGICWRVARQLVHEHGQAVRLWVDALDTFHRICPDVDAARDEQTVAGVEIRRWSQPMPAVRPNDVVVEAFACRVPESFLQAMAARRPRPVWINLEYFSAEAWVAEHHELSSPHPRLALTQYFFIPGIGPGTGGLPGSPAELKALAAFRADAAARQAFWSEWGLADDAALKLSLFAYDNPAIPGLIEALKHAGRPVRLLACEGKSLGEVAAGMGAAALEAGESRSEGDLTVQVLPFMPQERYDRLLWACDVNFVRGEDSFIRAQHAGCPLVWQAYVQEGGAQWPKIEAFLGRYATGLPPPAETALREAWRVWNAGESRPGVWAQWLAHLPAYRQHARAWAGKLQAWPNLVDKLVEFALSKV